MAHISQLSKSYRAVVRHKDYYVSRTFRTQEEAEAWAAAEEDAYYLRKNADVAQSVKLHTLPAAGQLPSLSEIRKAAAASPQGGVYFLLNGDEVVFVGESDKLLQRLADHLVSRQFGHLFDRYVVLPCSDGLRRPIEREYITLLKPRYNITGFPKDAA